MTLRLAGWAVLGGILLGGGACSNSGVGSDPGNGSREVWTADCGHGAALSLQLAYVPRDFVQGDAIGWGLGYRQGPDSLTWLYNNGILPEGGHGPTAMKFAGWNSAEQQLDAGPTGIYTPLPAAAPGRVILFDPAAGPGQAYDAPRTILPS